MTMQIDTDESIRFLNFIFKNCEDGSGNINLRCKDPSGRVHSTFVSVDHIEEIPSILSKQSDSDWWFGPALRNGNNGKKEGISLMPAVHLDHDALTDKIEEEIAFFLKPSAVVQSSLSHKKQYYWLLKDPAGHEQIPEVEDINLRLITRFEGDRGTQDASHVLRIPGTFNHKPQYGTPLQCKILELNPNLQYSLSDFDSLTEVKDRPKVEEQVDIEPRSKDWERAWRLIATKKRIMWHLIDPKPDDRSGHD